MPQDRLGQAEFAAPLPIEDVALGDLIESLLHQGGFDRVLNRLHLQRFLSEILFELLNDNLRDAGSDGRRLPSGSGALPAPPG